MAKINRIQQPYGYRDNGEYSSEANMLCNAITSLGKGDMGDLAAKVFFGVEYRDDLEAFVFLNSGGTPVATADMKDVKFSKLIESAAYNPNTKNIDIIFENGDVVSISTDGIVPFTAFKDGLEKTDDTVKVKIDPNSDEYLTLSENGVKVSGIKEKITTIETSINNEISDRTNNDMALSEKIDIEKGDREQNDKKIWDAIGEVSSSVTSGATTVIGMIETEINAREEADNNLKSLIGDVSSSLTSGSTSLVDMINKEADTRKNVDDNLKALIGDVSSAVTSGSTSLVDMINKETEARKEADDNLKALIGDVSSAVTSGQTSVVDLINVEKTERIAEDSKLNGLIGAEKTAREEAISRESTARTEKDTELDRKIASEVTFREETDRKLEQEITDRTSADSTINGRIDILSESNKLNVVDVEKVTSGLSQTIRESYKFKKADGTYIPQTVDIYKDSSLINVVLKEINNKKYLVFTYVLEDGTQKDIEVDVEELLIESEFSDGLSASSDGDVVRVKVKIDPSSDNYLSVSSDGVKISGIASAFDVVNTSINSLRTDVGLKADKTYVDNELAKKATVESLNTLSGLVSTKASTEYVDGELAKKADKVYVNGELANKASIDYVDGELANKASIDYVDGELAKKAVKSEVDSALELKADATGLTSEATTREQEDTNLSNRINAEAALRETSDNALDKRLTTIENDRSVLVHTISPIDNSVTINNADVSNPKVGVKISTHTKDTTHINNIKLETDGIFSVADLDYDGDINLLTFVNNDKTLPIYLKSISSIESINYNTDSKKLSVTYTVNGVSNTVEGDLSKLDNTFTVSEATNGALSLSMNNRVISGSVIVNSSHTDNALEMDNNSLYVSKDKIIGDLESRIEALENRLATLEASSNTLSGNTPIVGASEVALNSPMKAQVIDNQDFDLFDME